MARKSAQIRTLALAGALAVGLAPVCEADWLVTREGAQFEIQGAWEERGALVVFTLPDGKLSSMRRSELDLEASVAATEEALRGDVGHEDSEEATPPRKAVLTLTNDDIRAADSTATSPSDRSAGSERGPGARQAPTSTDPDAPVWVTNWKEQEASVGQGIEIVGTVESRSEEAVQGLRVVVTMINEEDQVLGENRALVARTSLEMGQTTSFRVVFPDIDKGKTRPRFALSTR